LSKKKKKKKKKKNKKTHRFKTAPRDAIDRSSPWMGGSLSDTHQLEFENGFAKGSTHLLRWIDKPANNLAPGYAG